MRGFFEREQIEDPIRRPGRRALSCITCRLYKNALSPKMEPYGKFRKRIMVIGETPGEEDDRKGRPWQGRAGRLLQRAYKQLGIDLFEDCVSINAVNCRPTTARGTNRAPNLHEINCCRHIKVMPVIAEYQPKVIILHGPAALLSVIGPRWEKDLGTFSRWVGFAIPDQKYHAWIVPTYHPSYIMRQVKDGEESELLVLWKRHLRKAFNLVDKPLPYPLPSEDDVEVTDDVEGVLMRILNDKPEMLAFDLETTGIKPYNREVHRIVCIGFSYNDKKAYAIPAPTTERQIELLRRIMRDRRIKKIAANMKFEHIWLSEMYGIEVRPWLFDTMLAAHVLDNRTKISSLKFQAYIRYGIVGYDREVSAYLHTKDGGAYSVNRVPEFIRSRTNYIKLATYCGLDALITLRLARDQMKEIGVEGGSSDEGRSDES